MSVTRQDAFPVYPGQLIRIEPPGDDAAPADNTEDLAEEITSELAQGSGPAAAVAPAPHAPATDAPATGTPAPEPVLRERYVLETQLGNGGSAVVYRATDLRRDASLGEGRRVAIKLLRPELRERADSVARLQREFRQTLAVAHPGVVRVHDLDCDHGCWFIVMELLSGESLAARLRHAPGRVLPQEDALSIGVEVGEALVHAHMRGITHGDVKPGNVFLSSAGIPKLLDFGVAPELPGPAAAADGRKPATGTVATRAYASPEVLQGERPEPRDDVFSLACVTYEMLAGAHPFGRRSREVAARTAAAPRALDALDAVRRSAIQQALDLTRASRPSMAELVRALRGSAVVEEPAPEQPAPVAIAPAVVPVASVPAAARPARTGLWLAVAAGLALALGLGFLIGRGEPQAAHSAAPASPAAAEQATTTAGPAPAEPANPAPAAAPAQSVPEQPVPAVQSLGLVSFDTPMMVVSHRAVVAAIPLRHFSRDRRAVEVTWRVVDGSARAGEDYGGPSTGVENFVEGNSFRIIYVPILPDRRSGLDRKFSVELTGATPDAELGPTPRVEVTILGTA